MLFTPLPAYLALVVKYRKGVFTPAMLADMAAVMEKVCSDRGSTRVKFNSEENHVHLLVHRPPAHALSRAPSALKGVSSCYLRKHHRSGLIGGTS